MTTFTNNHRVLAEKAEDIEKTRAEWNIRHFSYEANFRGSVLTFSRSRQPHYFHNEKIYSQARDIQVTTTLICANITQNELDRCSERLSVSKLHGQSETMFSPQMVRNLVREERILRYLKDNFSQFEEKRAAYTLGKCQSCTEIGQVSRAQLMGKMDDLRLFCHYFKWKEEQQYVANSDESMFGTILKTDLCMVSDTANALLMVPMDVFRDTDRNTKTYITQHPVFQQLKRRLYDSNNVKVNMQTFHWNQAGFRPRASFPARGRDSFEKLGGRSALSRPLPDNITAEEAANISSCGSVFYMKGQPEPAYMTDNSYGVLVVVVCYPDSMEINFPGGKRELGETPFDNALREVEEETGLRLAEDTFPLCDSDDKESCRKADEEDVDNLGDMMRGLGIMDDTKTDQEIVVNGGGKTSTSHHRRRRENSFFSWNPVFNFNHQIGNDKYVFLLEHNEDNV
jgi:hypothetical protein